MAGPDAARMPSQLGSRRVCRSCNIRHVLGRIEAGRVALESALEVKLILVLVLVLELALVRLLVLGLVH